MVQKDDKLASAGGDLTKNGSQAQVKGNSCRPAGCSSAEKGASRLNGLPSDEQNENAPADKPGEQQLRASPHCYNLARPRSAAPAPGLGAQMTGSHGPTRCAASQYLNTTKKGAADHCRAACDAPATRRRLHASVCRYDCPNPNPDPCCLNQNQNPNLNAAHFLLSESTNLPLTQFSNTRSRRNARRKRGEMLNDHANEALHVRPQALLIFHVETAGKQDDELGTDEMQAARIAYALYDLTANKVLDSGYRFVKPVKDEDASADTETATVTDECRNVTGITQEDLQAAKPLDEVLAELEGHLESQGLAVISDESAADTTHSSEANNHVQHEQVAGGDEKPMDTSSHSESAATNGRSQLAPHPHHVTYNFVVLTDGPAHLRMVLHPEATAKNLTLKPFWYRYFDLRKEFRRCCKVPADVGLNVARMLEMKELAKTDSPIYGQRMCSDLANIVAAIIKDGHQFTQPEVVRSFLEPGICYKNEFVDDDCVVRARGLPWQSTDQDVAKFFRGLNIAKGGVALCLTKQGRRNGEALVRFDLREFRDLALRRHKHHLKQRYIEVYRAGGRDFVNVAAGRTDEGHIFLQKLTAPDQCIVRMRGLPYTCTAEQILTFFNSGENRCEVQLGEDGVLFVHHPDGRATGDAFVLFENEQTASKALAKHKESIGNRYIELFRSTMAEVQQVLNQCHETVKPSGASGSSCLPPASIFGLANPQRSCIHLRGLPAGSTVADILAFLEEPHAKNIVLQGVHLVYNAQGMPVGEAFIQMNNELSAKNAALAKNGKTLKKHTVDVRQCFPDEMNLLIPSVGLLPTPPVPLLDPAAAALQAQLFAACGNPQLTAGLISRPHAYIPAANLPPRTQVAMATPTNASLTNLSPDSSMNSSSSNDLGAKDNHQITVVSTGNQPMPVGAQQPLMSAANVMPAGPGVAALAAAMQAPLFYWYPSPPISPQQLPFGGPVPPYYMAGLAAPQVSTVVLRGVPTNVTPQDLLHFFEGIYESTPEIQLAIGMDGRPTGDIYVTFATRIEAERAAAERNRKYLGNKSIEVAF